MTEAEDIRCGHCGKLLARGVVINLHIRCPRCRADNHVRATSPKPECHEHRHGDLYASPSRN
ncbi:Com family DNA-binding transcriptional regulator [Nitratidesulfovibrio vulgaris]|uniref:Com family DNA-binding transcriptional regulator n=1 Tax=Nitratidesulfovibrio vulgaris TaxID=881 RepID=UPI0013DF5A8C|nr:Com family DNA-binding transcriptional regulator [Nitratidesulfovibrio vulgaris]